MAATAYPFETHHHHHSHHRQEPDSHVGGGRGGEEGGSFDTQNPSFAPVSTEAVALKHNPSFSNCWTAEEQSVLEAGIANYALDTNVVRYAKIAIRLPCKTVRDVALRCKWMSYKESRRRKEDHTMTGKYKEKKDNFILLSRSNYLATCPSEHVGSSTHMDNHSGIYQAISGPIRLLLEENFRAFNQISANLTALQLQANINLFCRCQENLFKILNNLEELPDTMRHMPELPVRLNEELANSILPWAEAV